MEITKQVLNDTYTKAFNESLRAHSNTGYTVIDGNGKAYDDTGAGKFYLCGFCYLHYYCNTPEGRATHKFMKKIGMEPGKHWKSGFEVTIDAAGWHTNGMFEIMCDGYQAVADLLRENGHNVYLNSMLD